MNLFSSEPAVASADTHAHWRIWAAAGVVAGGVMLAGPSHAADVYWNIGLQAPGAVVEVANAPRVLYAPAPMVVAPAPYYGTAWVPVYPERRWRYRHHHRDEWRDDDRRWDGRYYERRDRYDRERRHGD